MNFSDLPAKSCKAVSAILLLGSFFAFSAKATDNLPPSVPSGLVATAVSSSQINLTWSPSTDKGGVTGYSVYENGTLIANVATTSYSRTGLAPSTSYCFSVAAYDAAGNYSKQSTSACATTPADTTPPSVPTLTATPVSTSQINLSWTASSDTGGSGLAGYKIFRGGVQIATTTTTSYSNTGLSASTTYCYTVAAYDIAGNTSAQSTSQCATTPAPPDTTAPSVPTSLTATAVSSIQINLSWVASTDTGGSGLAGYKIYRGGVQIATTTATSYSNTGLTASTSYCYTVAAYDGVGNTSAQTASRCATTPATADTTAPSVPTSLTATAVSSSQINLSWVASTDTGGSGLAGYKIFQGGVQIATTPGTTYSVTGLTASTTYCYSVSACDNAGNNSVQSTSQCATTSATVSGPANNNFAAAATAIAGSNITGSNVGATKEAGEPNHAGNAGGKSVWWRWTAPASGSVTISLAGSSFDTLLAVYTGSAVSSLTSVASNDDFNGNTSQVSFTATSGANYQIAVDGYSGATGNITMAITQSVTDTIAPSVPTLTAAAASSSQINLSWTASTDTGGSGLAGYRIYRGGTLIATTSATTYSNTGLASGTTYCYVVTAYDNAGNTASSTSVCATTSSCNYTLSSTSASLAATAGSGTVTITGCTAAWTASSSQLWASISPASGTGAATLTYTVQANTTPSNRTATLTIANQAFTLTQLKDSTPPTAPTLTATAVSSSQINLTWTASTDSGGSGLAGYKIYRGGTQIATTAGTTYSDTGLTASTSYCYTVAAYDNAQNNSVQSASRCATTTPPNPVISTNTWVQSFGGTGSDSAGAVAVDSSGNIYTAGTFNGIAVLGTQTFTSAGARDILLSKVSSDGTIQWAHSFGSTGDEYVRRLILDSSGNVYICGNFSGLGSFGGSPVQSAGGTDAFIAKYSPQGTFLWTRTFGGLYNDAAYSIALDATQQNIIATGFFCATVTFTPTTTFSSRDSNQDTVMAEYSVADGSPIWAKTFPNADLDQGLAVFVDRGNNIILAGNFSGAIDLGLGSMSSAGTAHQYDIYIAKFAPSGTAAPGTPIWAKRYGGSGADTLYGAALDGNGDLLLGGLFTTRLSDLGSGSLTGTGADSDIFLAKYSGSDGHGVWSRAMTCAQSGAVTGIGVDTLNDPIVCGYFYLGACNLGAQTFSAINGSYDVFAAKYNASTGAPVWAERFGGSGNEVCSSIAVDPANYSVVVGSFEQSASFGGTTMTSAGATDAFVLRLDP